MGRLGSTATTRSSVAPIVRTHTARVPFAGARYVMRVPSGESEGAAFSGYANRTSRGMSSTTGTLPVMPRGAGALLAPAGVSVERQANRGGDVARARGRDQATEAELRRFGGAARGLRDGR